MAKPKLPEYFKDFKYTCKGTGSTFQEATHALSQNIDYVKRWIRGKCISEIKWGDHKDSTGTDINVYCDLLFRQRVYLRNRSR